MMSPDSTPNQLGNYDIVDKIADGGMGTVYKARNRLTQEIVAVKVIPPSTARNHVLMQRFEREFMAARVLDHPNIVRSIEYCGSGTHPFLVMEYVDGESLGQRVERAGAFAEEVAVDLIRQVCEGLQRAHKQGLVHRDVKPDNILVTRDGVAKLADMGLVKDIEGDLNLTKTGRGLGTPHYMAPEQFRNAKGVDIRGDIYSLGATLYAIVTGQVPFENASPLDCWMKKINNEFAAPKELNPNISERVDWAIRRAMSAEPDRRPSSCREFIEDLTGHSRTTPIKRGSAQPDAIPATDIWYLVYKDENGTTHTVKGSTEGIRKALQDQLLGDATTILISRSKTGQFTLLTAVPEFRDLVITPAALPTHNGARLTPVRNVLAQASGVIPRTGHSSGRYRRPANDDAGDPNVPIPDGGKESEGRVASSSRKTPDKQMPTERHSGRHAAPPIRQVPDSETDTLGYNSGPTPISTPTPTRLPASHRSQPPSERPKKAFDWTVIVWIIVMLVSATLGYVVLNR